VIRGDTVALIGEIDVEIESGLNFANIKADPLNPIFH
jgi:hypothetical protein